MAQSTFLDFNEANAAAAVGAGYEFTPNDGSVIDFNGSQMFLQVGHTFGFIKTPTVTVTPEVYGFVVTAKESEACYHLILVSFDDGATWNTWGVGGWSQVVDDGAFGQFAYALGLSQFAEIGDWPAGTTSIKLWIGVISPTNAADGYLANLDYLHAAADSVAVIPPGEPDVVDVVTNGTFPTDISSWSAQFCAWTSANGGAARFSHNAGPPSVGYLAQLIADLVPGQVNHVRFTLRNVVSVSTLYVYLGSTTATAYDGTEQALAAANGTYEFDLECGAGQYLVFKAQTVVGSMRIDVDDVSCSADVLAPVRASLLNSVTNGDFPIDLAGWDHSNATWDAANGGSCKFAALSGPNTVWIAQQLPVDTIKEGRTYRVSMTVYNLDTPTQAVRVGIGLKASATSLSTLPGTAYATTNANGVQTFDLVCPPGGGLWIKVQVQSDNVASPRFYVDDIQLFSLDYSLALLPDYPLNGRTIKPVMTNDYVGGYQSSFAMTSVDRTIVPCEWKGKTDAEYAVLRAFLRDHRTRAFWWQPPGDDVASKFIVATDPEWTFKKPFSHGAKATLLEVFPQ